MWRGDSGDDRPMAGIAVHEARRNVYRAAPENTPAAPMPSLQQPPLTNRLALSGLNSYVENALLKQKGGKTGESMI